METNVRNTASDNQNENSAPNCLKKKSGIPVPVWKSAQNQRQALGTVTQFQQNAPQINLRLGATQQPADKTNDCGEGARKQSAVTRGENQTRKTTPLSIEHCSSNNRVPQDYVSSSAVYRTPKPLVATPKMSASKSAVKQPGKTPNNVMMSLIKEQQESDIQFQKDSNALRSILTNTGIAVCASGTLSEMFKPQRTTEGQGRPVYTPAKHAAQMRNSVYTKEPRMSLIDSCKQYQKFYRQTRGLEEQSDSASPVLASRGSPKVSVSESPLVKGMKFQRMGGSVYPKWSHHNLFSPFSQQQSNSHQYKEMNTPNSTEESKEVSRTPKTPLMAFRREPVTPLQQSARHKGTPGTLSLMYSRVATTPARRVPVQSSNKSGLKLKTESSVLGERNQDSTKKKLRWADVLSACSSDLQGTQKTARQDQADACTSGSRETSNSDGVFTQATQPTADFSTAYCLTSTPTGQPSSSSRHATFTTIRALNTADAAADDDGDDDSPALTLPTTARSLADNGYGQGLVSSSTSFPTSSSFDLSSSTDNGSVRVFAAPVHRQYQACGGDKQHAATVGELAARAASINTRAAVVSSSSLSSVDVREGQVSLAPYARPATPTDILARLQVLEQRERGIQNEMQLLRMAMQREQEGDSNGNDVSHAAASQDQANHSSSTHISSPVINQQPSTDGTLSSLHCLLQGPRFELPHHNPLDVQSVPMDSLRSPATNRPAVLFSTTATSTSSTRCNQAYCNTGSFAVESDSSSSPDINSNILTSDLKTSDSTCLPCDVLVLKQGTGDVRPDIWPTENTTVLTSDSREMASSGKAKDSLRLTSAEDKTGNEQNDSNVGSSLHIDMSGSRCLTSFEDTPDQTMVRESYFTKKDGGIFNQTCSLVRDIRLSGLQSETEQCDVNFPPTTVYSGGSFDQVNVAFSARHQGQKTFQADVSLRHSVDMDDDESENEDESTQPCTSKSLTPLIPQTARGTGLAGREQPLTSLDPISKTFCDGQNARVNPVSVIVLPSAVLSPALHDSHHHTGSMQVSPPIWTTLALQSAARNNCLTSSNMKQQTSVTSDVHGQQPIAISSLCREVEEVVASVNQNVSLSPKLARRDSPTKRVGHRHRSVSPALKTFASPNKRSLLHGTLRRRHSPIPSSVLKNPDVFLEALLEDECALYAGRLQSFFKNKDTYCDRQELPDPVARILNEGDDMHFIPICDDTARNRRLPFENSAFAACSPV